MKLPPGVSLLPSGAYRWRVTIKGRPYSGTEAQYWEIQRDRVIERIS